MGCDPLTLQPLDNVSYRYATTLSVLSYCDKTNDYCLYTFLVVKYEIHNLQSMFDSDIDSLMSFHSVYLSLKNKATLRRQWIDDRDRETAHTIYLYRGLKRQTFWLPIRIFFL